MSYDLKSALNGVYPCADGMDDGCKSEVYHRSDIPDDLMEILNDVGCINGEMVSVDVKNNDLLPPQYDSLQFFAGKGNADGGTRYLFHTFDLFKNVKSVRLNREHLHVTYYPV